MQMIKGSLQNVFRISTQTTQIRRIFADKKNRMKMNKAASNKLQATGRQATKNRATDKL
jgi:hypothetical protein